MHSRIGFSMFQIFGNRLPLLVPLLLQAESIEIPLNGKQFTGTCTVIITVDNGTSSGKSILFNFLIPEKVRLPVSTYEYSPITQRSFQHIYHIPILAWWM